MLFQHQETICTSLPRKQDVTPPNLLDRSLLSQQAQCNHLRVHDVSSELGKLPKQVINLLYECQFSPSIQPLWYSKEQTKTSATIQSVHIYRQAHADIQVLPFRKKQMQRMAYNLGRF